MKALLVALQAPPARLRSEDGATAVEYGIMVALIAIVIIGAVTAVGDSLIEIFTDVALTTALGG